jgi:hypothetical protein
MSLTPDQLIGVNSGAGQTPSPWFTIANQFMPRNLHDVIRWARYITVQSPTTTEVIRKQCTYPITEFIVDTDSNEIEEKYRELFESFKLKQKLQDIGFDYHTLGNVFVSVYFPIYRSLRCPGCANEYSARKAEFISFKKYEFYGECPKCQFKGNFIRKDTKSMNIAEMNIIKWDPENIAVAYNAITDESEYYYKIPNDIKRKIQQGDKLLVNTIPWGIIEAVKNNQDFKFDTNNIFHLRNLSTGAVVEGISIPPLISLFNLVFYQATLRKANESIATEHMNPLRVVFPQPQTANSDPVVAMSLRNFVDNMELAIKRHKRDKGYFLIAPGPVGYQPVGGEGKNLLVSAEIQQAEDQILLALGVSRELLSGTTNWTSSTVGLRMLANTLESYTTQVEKLMDWIIRKVTTYLNITYAKVTLAPFRLADDDVLKANLITMAQQPGGSDVSKSTMMEMFGMDYKRELERKKEDAIAEAQAQVELEFEVDQAVFMAGKKTGDKLDRNTDYQAKLIQATDIANELSGPDAEMAQDVLSQLKLGDYTLYVLVKKMLQDRVLDQQLLTDPNAMGEDGQPGQPGGGQPGGQKKSQPAPPKNPGAK